MQLQHDNPLLNLFRFVGHTRVWEDNVTRALLSVATRSPCGAEILRSVLGRVVRHATKHGVMVRTELLYSLSEAVRDIEAIEVSYQESYTSAASEDTDRDFAVLVCLTPAGDRQESDAPSITSETGIEDRGRYDVVLRCRGAEYRFDVVIEVKLYTDVAREQRRRYIQSLGVEKCIQVDMAWSEILDVLSELSDPCRGDPLVKDLEDFLTDLYWLTGFRGFQPDDFTPDRAARRRTRLLQLAAELVTSDPTDDIDIVARRELKGGFDIDFYLGGQFKLIGNTGIASWGSESLLLKLVVGTFQYYESGQEQRAIVERISGEKSPRFTTYWGLRALLKADAAKVADTIGEAAERWSGLNAQVGYRCFFNRFQDLWIWSWERTVENAVNWRDVDEALRVGEPVEGVREVTKDSLQSLRRFAQDPDRDFAKPIELLELGTRRKPAHHAALVLTKQVPASELRSRPAREQIDYVADQHARMATLLRELSTLCG